MKEIDPIALRIRALREFLALGRGALEKETGIRAKTIENMEQGKQKVYAEHITALAKKWPEFSYWLLTGETIPEAGQISPEIEKQRQDLGGVGRAA